MEVKAIITEYGSNNRKETSSKEIIKTEQDFNKFKASIRLLVKDRQKAFHYIRRTDFYFVSNFTGMWQMSERESITNSGYFPSVNSRKNLSSNRVDESTIEVDGKLRSLKITAAVSRGWYKFIDTMPMTPSEITLAKSILASPSGRFSHKQYMTMKDLKDKVNKRKPISR